MRRSRTGNNSSWSANSYQNARWPEANDDFYYRQYAYQRHHPEPDPWCYYEYDYYNQYSQPTWPRHYRETEVPPESRQFPRQQRQRKPKNPLPDRWEAYTKIGSRIGKTCLIAMKVPLNTRLNDMVQIEAEQFSCSTAMELVEQKQHKELGMVINLCNTTRYYNKEEFTQKGVLHKHINVPGHVIPKDEFVQEFANGIREFESRDDNKHKLVAVHCTHGLNRTGYLVCRYLIEEKGMSPEDAIRLFNDTRGHKMERQNYIDDLSRRSVYN